MNLRKTWNFKISQSTSVRFAQVLRQMNPVRQLGFCDKAVVNHRSNVMKSSREGPHGIEDNPVIPIQSARVI